MFFENKITSENTEFEMATEHDVSINSNNSTSEKNDVSVLSNKVTDDELDVADDKINV